MSCHKSLQWKVFSDSQVKWNTTPVSHFLMFFSRDYHLQHLHKEMIIQVNDYQNTEWLPIRCTSQFFAHMSSKNGNKVVVKITPGNKNT